ncbi:MAG: zinc ribbon domain-containing protein [Ruminococcus sp.]|jgi:hypothetical protein|nr:zinc ribbon domain-containing protein [Ruminococcus sp.]
MFCPNCGSEIRNDSIYCASCGGILKKFNQPGSSPISNTKSVASDKYQNFVFFGLSVLGLLMFFCPIIHIEYFGNVNGLDLLFGKIFEDGDTEFKMQNSFAMITFLLVPLMIFLFSSKSIRESESPKYNQMIIFGISGIVADIIAQFLLSDAKRTIHLSDSWIFWDAASSALEISLGLYISYVAHIGVVLLALDYKERKRKALRNLQTY